jgi:hypothetical protein
MHDWSGCISWTRAPFTGMHGDASLRHHWARVISRMLTLCRYPHQIMIIRLSYGFRTSSLTVSNSYDLIEVIRSYVVLMCTFSSSSIFRLKFLSAMKFSNCGKSIFLCYTAISFSFVVRLSDCRKTGLQRMLTPSRHLILPSHLLEVLVALHSIL